MGHLLRKCPVPDPRRIIYTPPVLAPNTYFVSGTSNRRFTGGVGGLKSQKHKIFRTIGPAVFFAAGILRQGFNF